MKLDDARVLFAAQYAAPYEGNFISSLVHLEQRLQERFSAECAYLFPYKATEQSWWHAFSCRHKVYVSGDDTNLISPREIDKVLRDYRPTLVHTHFEGYDVPVARAVSRSGRAIRQVWHMHDYLTFHPNPFKALYQSCSFLRHYGVPFLRRIFSGGGNPCIIGVCPHEPLFIRPFRLWTSAHETIIPNGVDCGRIRVRLFQHHRPFTFLAFGGRNISKRVDVLFRAGQLLSGKGVEFSIMVTKGSDTAAVAEECLGAKLPSWLRLVEQVEDINKLFEQADCFVSSSVFETFSYAVAEASVYGLPVVQSDIDGTMWNAGNPSAFMFNTGNASALATAMEEVMGLSEIELRHRCETTKKNNIENYSLEAWCNRVIDFYISMP